MIIRAEVQSHSIYSRGTDRQKEIQPTIWWEAIVDAVLPDSSPPVRAGPWGVIPPNKQLKVTVREAARTANYTAVCGSVPKIESIIPISKHHLTSPGPLFLTRTSGRTYWWQRPGQCPSKCCTQTSPGHAPVRPPRFRRCCCRPDRRDRCCSPRPWIPLCWPAPCHSKTGDPRPPLYLPYEWGRLRQPQPATCLDPSRANVSRESQASVTGPKLLLLLLSLHLSHDFRFRENRETPRREAETI